jgi:hypothetical protein
MPFHLYWGIFHNSKLQWQWHRLPIIFPTIMQCNPSSFNRVQVRQNAQAQTIPVKLPGTTK